MTDRNFSIALTVGGALLGAFIGIFLSNIFPGTFLISVEERAFDKGFNRGAASLTEQQISAVKDKEVNRRADIVCSTKVANLKLTYNNEKNSSNNACKEKLSKSINIIENFDNSFDSVKSLYEKVSILASQKSPGGQAIKNINYYVKQQMITMDRYRKDYKKISSSFNGPAKELLTKYKGTNLVDIYTLKTMLGAVLEQEESKRSNLNESLRSLKSNK